MPIRLVAPLLLAAAAGLVLPSPARAQIYSWRDAAGVLIVSNKPPAETTRTFSVANDNAFRAAKAPLVRNATRFDDLIHQHAAANAVNPGLVRAVIQAESGFDPTARSRKGAMGLMQLMPATAAQYGVTNAYDPAQNIRAGVTYLRDLLSRYGDDVTLALAAYNAGPGAVEKYGTVPPYRETREYVSRVRSRADVEPPPATRITKSIEVIDGRAVPRYTNRRP